MLLSPLVLWLFKFGLIWLLHLSNAQGAQVVNEDGRRYVYAVLQSSTNSKEDVDDLEFLFKVSSLVASITPKSNPSLQHFRFSIQHEHYAYI